MEKYHFIGIGGIGMSGLAKLLLHRHVSVSGSDLSASKTTDALIDLGANIYIGQTKQNIKSEMTVVYSTDIKKDNPEYSAAVDLKCPLMHRSELLQKIIETHHSLAVAGTHGKTTTSSLLTWVFEKSGQFPSYAVGGIIPQLLSNAGHGSGKYFVLEACESDGSFLNYKPFGAIVTNIDLDHMDYYKTESALENAFKQFMHQVSSTQHLFWCGDDEGLLKIQPNGISYGFNDRCQLRALNFSQNEWAITFDVAFQGRFYSQVEVSLIGKHNALNALAVFGLAISLGLEETQIRNALKSFGGVLRRCEKKGESHGILFMDDYGHHPTEIKATLSAVRLAIGERRLVVLYQPHRYSRAKECMGLYGDVFKEADLLFITEIYASREQPIPGVTHEEIISEIKTHFKQPCHHIIRKEIAGNIIDFLRPHDVVLTLGAGDITAASGEILKAISLKAPPKLKVGVVYGGSSVEHEISLMSVKHIIASLNPDYYDLEEFFITRAGEWQKQNKQTTVLSKKEEVFSSLLNNDIIFPVLHGPCGEDGTIQGMLEMFSKAYVGCDYRSAAISMDKVMTKIIALAAGIPIVPFVTFNNYQWNCNKTNLLLQIQEKLRYPLYVKPSHLGSAVGVHKVLDVQQLVIAIEDALRFDTNILIENGIEGREIEFALIGNYDVEVFPPGEILGNGQTYDYENKYGANSMATTPSADLSSEQVQMGMALVKRAYEAIGCMGMARIDTFLDREGKFWLNEVNPIPGFTKISLYPQMCAVNGLESEKLMDRLIVLGLERRRQLDRLKNVPI